MTEANRVQLPIPRVPNAAYDETGRAGNIYDFRFRALLLRTDWNMLPAAVQRRFSKRLSEGRVALYAGTITETRFSKMGWLLAQSLRIVGAPLPIRADTGCPAVVNVAEDTQHGGQLWTRVYHHQRGFPQTINSAKRFAGRTGLEEHIGYGIGMALRVNANHEALTFTSDHYFITIAGLRMRLPKWITPGITQVCHIDRGGGVFDFTLRLTHPLLGELLYQSARFHDQ
jgi:hypothetical protein